MSTIIRQTLVDFLIMPQEVGINKLSPDFVGVDDIDKLQALEIFSQFDGESKEAAEAVLLNFVPMFNGKYTSAQLSILHTASAGNTLRVGTSSFIDSAIGAANVGGSLVLTPIGDTYWKCVSIPAHATKLRIKSNIVANDCIEQFNVNVNGITGWYSQAYLPSSSTGTVGERQNIDFGKTGLIGGGSLTIISGGPTYAGNIGDNGTFQAEIPITNTNANQQVGIGGTYSDYLFIFAVQIASLVNTKTYKFIFELEYAHN